MKLRGALLAPARGLGLAVMTLVGSITLLVLSVISIALIALGLGVFTTPHILNLVRAYANHRRLLAHEWGGITIPLPYRQLPPDVRKGVVGQVERCSLMLKDPATWRDLQWLLVDMTAGFVTAVLPAGLIAEGLFGFVLAAGVWHPVHESGDGLWYAFIPVDSQSTANSAAVLGAIWITIALAKGPELLRGHFRLSRSLLQPTHEMTLEQRVDRLTETRHDALDTSAAELRRIERDLHDGAQARLVAMGMTLGVIDAMIEKDPAKARKLLAQARESSADALTELRDLVRGIHPPVLAERGLGDAVRALALRMPLDIEVEVDLPGRAEEPVESAAYFAVSEVLTNVAKHSGAERVWLDLHYDAAAGTLRVSVTDDGKGGADVAKGTGLSGIERRLGTFDGVLAVNSPVGGPTMVTMEIPCALSSPKTSSS
ncbi:sensor histidine kinase [Streptomyces sp. H27-D2]|uniref:sensor histidine kinase n=1 Tax=Streptomyces sp. H27-D2 TaxID=3046304 RepID=UPI002DB92C3B|nr:histidine kinase [Streptomyces sp. H27-D2]MEC4017204.1 histidine kinase [Streptomyces sp. H27-D2]